MSYSGSAALWVMWAPGFKKGEKRVEYNSDIFGSLVSMAFDHLFLRWTWSRPVDSFAKPGITHNAI